MKWINPVPYKEVTKISEVPRMVFCINYDNCLDRAIKHSWPGFSCQTCEAYEQKIMDAFEVRQDTLICIAIWEQSNKSSHLKRSRYA